MPQTSPFRVPDTNTLYDKNAPTFAAPTFNFTGNSNDSALHTESLSGPSTNSILSPVGAPPSTSLESSNSLPPDGSTVSGASRQNSERSSPWYRYMTLGPDLARELQESEHLLLPIAPVPLNIRADNQKRDHVVLLRASNSERFASFRTAYGHVFAKSNVVVLVSTSQKIVRICNLNGKEGQVLFKLSNGQLICIGAGSEMIIAPGLENISLNANDGLARRGITRLPKDAQLQMAFAQFSFDSFFELPEVKYFRSTLDGASRSSLDSTAAYLDGIRGVTGFRKAIAVERLPVARKPAPVPEKRPTPQIVAATERSKNSATAACAGRNAAAEPTQPQRPRPTAVSALQSPQNSASTNTKEKTAMAPTLEKSTSGFSSRIKALGKIATRFKSTEAHTTEAPAAAHRQPVAATAKVALTVPAGAGRNPNTSVPDSDADMKSATVQNMPAKAGQTGRSNQVSVVRAHTPGSGQPLYVDYDRLAKPKTVTRQARLSSTDPSLSADAKQLLASAEKEERRAIAMRKQVKRNNEFLNSGFLNSTQCQRMSNETSQLNVNAALAEERAANLRKEAMQAAAKPVSPAM